MMYSKVMIHAFAEATGRTVLEALTDLGLAGTIGADEIGELSGTEESYLKDVLSTEDAVNSWRNITR